MTTRTTTTTNNTKAGRGGGPVGGGSLGKLRDSRPVQGVNETSDQDNGKARRAQRYARQELAKELLPGERINACLLTLAFPRGAEGKSVKVMLNQKTHKAYYHGLMRCSSVWACPLCAPKITQARLEELQRGLANWNGSVFMSTFTMQHNRETETGDAVNIIEEAVRRVKSGGWYKRFEERYQIAGNTKGFEPTFSRVNGPHPHFHIMFWSKLPAGEVQVKQIELELYERFSYILAKFYGRYTSKEHGVRVERAFDAQSEGDQAAKVYIAKWGILEELAKGPVKKARDEHGITHYSPFELLDLWGEAKAVIAAGLNGKGYQWDKIVSLGLWASKMYKEYYFAVKGRRQLRWSPGLKAALGLVESEKSDEELAGDQVGENDQVQAVIDPTAWYGRIVALRLRSKVLDLAELGSDLLEEQFKGLGLWQTITGVWTWRVKEYPPGKSV